MDADKFVKELRQNDLVGAIKQAEQKTSGQIRVFITRQKPENILVAAQEKFKLLGMHKTTGHNGVLIYAAPLARKFAIIGDSAVHEKCGEAFWKTVAQEIEVHFRRGEFTEGLRHGIGKAGKLLEEHFPAKPGHVNELSDDVEHD